MSKRYRYVTSPSEVIYGVAEKGYARIAGSVSIPVFELDDFLLVEKEFGKTRLAELYPSDASEFQLVRHIVVESETGTRGVQWWIRKR